MKKFLLVVAGLVAVVGSIFFVKGAQIVSLVGWIQESERAGLPPVSVATAVAKAQEWERVLRYTGTLRPVQGVTLAAEEGGTIAKIAVENGARVRAGELLVEIDTRRERADLASAEASLQLAELNLRRARGLLEKRIVAQSELDAAEASYREALARVESLRATISKKTIAAPFDGQVGIRQVNLGQTVRPGDPLLPLHSGDPIYVEFAVPQTRLRDVEVGQVVRLSGGGIEGEAVGSVTAMNPQVDEPTRTARVQGTVRNPDGQLRPGQFVTVDVVLPGKESVVAIPASAVVKSAYGDSVFLVEEGEGGKLVARQQFVRLGGFRGDFVAVEKGLAEGQRVVSAGAFKLSNGVVVLPDDSMQPEVSLEPSPENS